MADVITIATQDLSFVEDIVLDFREQFTAETIKFPQYDSNTRYIRATLYVNGQPFTATSSQIITFSATKPDGYGVYNEAGIDDEGRIVYEITEQTTNYPGTFPACFTIYDTKTVSGVTITRRKASFNFKIHVAKSALNDDTIISANEFKVLTNLIATVGDIIVDGNALLISLTNLENEVEIAEAIRVSSEEERVSNEETRVEHDLTRPIWTTKTWTQYNALTQEEKDDLMYFYTISDSENVEDFVDELQTLIDETNAAKDAAEQIVISQNNINDSAINSIQTWSSLMITKQMRLFSFSAVSTTTSITHGLNYVPSTDFLMVIYNGLILEENKNFSNSADYHTINLTSWSIPSGDTVICLLLKNVK
jgi:hypothetical protein